MPIATFKRFNSDGSRNVGCTKCNNFIGIVAHTSPFHSALCIVCQAEEDGIDLTAEQVREMRAVMVNGQVMSLAAAFPDPGIDPMEALAEKPLDAAIGRPGSYMKALVKVSKAIKEAVVETYAESKALAKEKRSKRIFDLPLDQDIKNKNNV